MEQPPCPKCGSTERIPDAKVTDCQVALELEVSVQARPNGFLFNGRVSHKVKAQVCGDCGYIEFYADNPQKLLEIARRGLERSGS